MADLTAHEKYLRGEPLNPELALLREGRDLQPSTKRMSTERKGFSDPERELSRAERLDLKEWKEMPGWDLYLRLAERVTIVHQKRAISLSQDDPFGNRDELAYAWAYVKMLRRAVAELETLVSMEVAELENEK